MISLPFYVSSVHPCVLDQCGRVSTRKKADCGAHIVSRTINCTALDKVYSAACSAVRVQKTFQLVQRVIGAFFILFVSRVQASGRKWHRFL